MKVRLTRLARRDIASIGAYLAEFSPKAAETTVTRIRAAARSLADYPYRAPARDEVARGLRLLTIADYVLLFRIEGDEVIVNRILHGSRDWRRLV